MREGDIIAKTHAAFGGPVTRSRIADDLESLGLDGGDIVLVHTALSAIGWIVGGAESYIRALLDVIGPKGTLVMPTHSGALSDPGLWENPPVPVSWVDIIRDLMPPFDPRLTPTRGMGTVPELFRRFPGVRRSSHPMDSFSALGPAARKITAGHALVDGLGEGGPLARLYELDARVLLVGCGHENNTSMHLAEIRSEWPGKKRIRQGSPLTTGGRRTWKWYDEVEVNSDDFGACGRAYEDSPAGSEMCVGDIGLAVSRLMSQRSVVDFAVGWIGTHRGRMDGEDPA